MLCLEYPQFKLPIQLINIIASHQKNDPELKAAIESSSLNLQLMQTPQSTDKIYCDINNNIIRPYIPEVFRKKFVDNLHEIANNIPFRLAKHK